MSKRKGLACRSDCVLVVVDIQESFLAPIAEKEQVLERAKFLIEVAKELGVPILVTEQYAARMGHTHPEILSVLPEGQKRFDKLCFSSCLSDEFMQEWGGIGRKQVVLVGIETHICVNQTAHDFLNAGADVFVCSDATGCRPRDAHEDALKRMRHAGVVIAHTESVAYEWMKQAGTDEFKKVLQIVKKYPV